MAEQSNKDDDFYMPAEQWSQMWKDNKAEFHSNKVDELLVEFHKKLIKENTSKADDNVVFVPLCGKDPGMKYLLDKNMTVVGVEVSPIACREFFDDYKIKFKETPLSDDCTSFESIDTDLRVKLFACDFYKVPLSELPTFTAIWDRGALNAINATDRTKYMDIIKGVMTKGKGCVNLTVIDESDDWEILNLEGVKHLFGDGYSAKKIKTIEAAHNYKDQGLSGFTLYEILVDDFYMPAEQWSQMWKDNKAEFHSNKVDELLVEFHKKLIKENTSKADDNVVFVPLCGKDPGMKYLLDKNMTVVGVEVSPIACREFFDDYKIKFKETPLSDDCTSFESIDTDLRVKLFACDFYKVPLSELPTFTAIWDRGALNAINATDRTKYMDIIKGVMTKGKGCVNLTVIDESDDWEILNLDGVKQLFGDDYSVKKIKTIEAAQNYKDQGLSGFTLYEILVN